MKIGILTFHYVHNFGAVLQAYGLLQYINSLGYESHVIDYRNQRMNQFWNSPKLLKFSSKENLISNLIHLLGNLSRMILYPIKLKRKKIFNSFAKRRLNLSNIDEEFDICVYGSDQIWGLDHIGDDMTFLGSDKIRAKKRIAYAASAGETEQEVIDSPFIREYLKKYSAISVRENTFFEKFKKAGFNCSLVLDPSLLCEESIFSKIAVRPKINNYVFCYRALESLKLPKVASKVAEQLNCKTIEVRCTTDKRTFKEMLMPGRYKQFATPEEFLGYINNAECIITTSFHGVAFSIVFRKSFYFISTRNKRENRITSLLEQLGLTDRIINEGDVPTFTLIDYKAIKKDGTSIEQKLYALREYSQNWLKEAIKQ